MNAGAAADGRALRTAVVGHVEWTSIARVSRVPSPGEVTHADTVWEGPAGGGSVAAVQLASVAGETTFFTALGDDEEARRTTRILERLNVRVLAAPRTGPTRRAVSLIDDSGERTTTTLGPRLQPSLDDPLPWSDLAACDVVHFVAGDPGALKQARAARVLVATSRESATLAASGVRPDAVAGSSADPAEQYEPTLHDCPPEVLVMTEGRQGGRYRLRGEPAGRYRALPPPGPEVDGYGMGDNFAAALAHALGTGAGAEEALAAAAERAAECAATRGPYRLPVL